MFIKVPVPKHISMPAPELRAESPAPTPIVFTEPPPPQQQQQIPTRREEEEEPMEQGETDYTALEVKSEAASQVKHYHHHHHLWHPCRPVQE